MLIKTTSGTVQSKLANSFLGIPFAKGEHFQKPKIVSWDGTLNCNDYGKMPPQEAMLELKSEFDEDCLNLNIHTPNVNGKYPVVVEFYGGAFQGGSNRNAGTGWLDQEEIVHVTFNYRLGYLGWPLKTSVGIANYNLGLYDQFMALQWVKKNIASFGGNAENISLYGFSAGAKSIAALLSSELPVKNLFNKICLSSGAYQCIRSEETAKSLDNLFRSETNFQGNFIDLGDEQIIQLQRDFVHHHESTSFFGPVIDGISITNNWYQRLQENLPQKAILSSSYNECGGYLSKDNATILQQLLPDLFGKNRQFIPENGQNQMEYPEVKGRIVQMISDAGYRLHTHRLGNLYRSLGVEVYEYDYSVYPAYHCGDVGLMNDKVDSDKATLQVKLRKVFIDFFNNQDSDFSFAFKHPTIKNYYEITNESTPQWHNFYLIDTYPLIIFDSK